MTQQRKTPAERTAGAACIVGDNRSSIASIALDITHKDIAQQNTPSQTNCGAGYANDLDKPFVSNSASLQAESRRALEERKKEPPKPLCFFPALVDVLGRNDAKVAAAICRLGWDQQREASRLMAMESTEAALDYICEQT